MINEELGAFLEQGILGSNSAENDPTIIAEPLEKGFISKEFFDFNIKHIGKACASQYYAKESADTKSVHSRLGNNYLLNNFTIDASSDYIPIYCLGLNLDSYIPFGFADDDVYNKVLNITNNIAKIPEYYRNFLKLCIEKKMYNILFTTRFARDSNLKGKALRNSLLKSFGTIVNATIDLNPCPANYINYLGAASCIISANKYSSYLNHWVYIKGDEDIITNLYFAAYPHGNDRLMYSLCVKRSEVKLARACALTNTPIPVNILKFFYDVSQPDIKSITTSMLRSGIECSCKVDEISRIFCTYESFSNRYATREGKEKFISSIGADFINDERDKRGIPLIGSQLAEESNKVGEIMKSQKEAFDEILDTIDDSNLPF